MSKDPAYLRREVPLADLRHNDKAVYREQGFGGQPLDRWPVTGFFRRALAGDRAAAAADFTEWYLLQFARYARVPLRDGGVRHGSLYQLVASLHQERTLRFDVDAGVFDADIVRGAARERVAQRFALLDRMVAEGFRMGDAPDWIEGVQRGPAIVLQGGHHRVAALLVMGHPHLPAMQVFPGTLRYSLHRALRRIGR